MSGSRNPQPPHPTRTNSPDALDITELASRIRDLHKQALTLYTPLVQDILRSDARDVRHIEHTLDGLLDFCGDPPVVLLYRQLCRHYWKIDPSATASYVRFYREMWDSDLDTPEQ